VRGIASRLRFTNSLKDAFGVPLSHIIPVDTTVPGASGRHDRIATHLHGGAVPWVSDGGPFDWWASDGAKGMSFMNGPGSKLDNIGDDEPMVAGQADYFYPNDQSTRLMWYHDHAFGITRLNAYAGIATGYLCLDPAQEAAITNTLNYLGLAAPNPNAKVPSILSTVPIVIQEKKFVDPNTDPTWNQAVSPRTDLNYRGALWYEHVYDPARFKQLKGLKYGSPPDPSCIPEFFGDTMLVNGLVHPVLTLEAKAYRFHLLNATNARFLNINLRELNPGYTEVVTDPGTMFADANSSVAGPPLWQIGTEGGYLATEVVHENITPANLATFTGNLFVGPAERPDFVVDFTGVAAGTEFILYNDLSGPYPGGDPGNDYFAGNPVTPQAVVGSSPDTRNILKIKIVGYSGGGLNPVEPLPAAGMLAAVPRNKEPFIVNYPANPVAPMAPLSYAAVTPAPRVRNLTLNENFDDRGRLRQLVGTTSVKPGTGGYGRLYLDPATEVSTLGNFEVWNIYNLTADTHPMHFHCVNVQILKRQPFRLSAGRFILTGTARGPEMDELGWKETCKMNPGEMIQVIMKIELPAVPFEVEQSPRTGNNEFVWHCHILEHEEHDMMRPFIVVGANPFDAAKAPLPT
jgi:spore coat protein A